MLYLNYLVALIADYVFEPKEPNLLSDTEIKDKKYL